MFLIKFGLLFNMDVYMCLTEHMMYGLNFVMTLCLLKLLLFGIDLQM